MSTHEPSVDQSSVTVRDKSHRYPDDGDSSGTLTPHKDHHFSAGIGIRMMHLALFLALPLLQLCSQVQTASLPTEAVRMKLRVDNMARQLVSKIETIMIPKALTTSLPSAEQLSVCSVVQYLNLSSSLIWDRFNRSQELKSEISSLSGFVDQSSQCHCSGKARAQAPSELEKLRKDKERFPIAVSLTVLHLLKEYLKNMLEDMDQLRTCT
ncbi:hypothetical protein WMY93_022962 [Mugilogobius chulae]|uniref:Leptin n=1 Tax=Mugilogobius chulae TaxID=88201 RepID=A0AAW0N312_9GOBI